MFGFSTFLPLARFSRRASKCSAWLLAACSLAWTFPQVSGDGKSEMQVSTSSLRSCL